MFSKKEVPREVNLRKHENVWIAAHEDNPPV